MFNSPRVNAASLSRLRRMITPFSSLATRPVLASSRCSACCKVNWPRRAEALRPASNWLSAAMATPASRARACTAVSRDCPGRFRLSDGPSAASAAASVVTGNRLALPRAQASTRRRRLPGNTAVAAGRAARAW
ncbi:hypothetical protein D3C78_1378690 [compost metagenome]